MLSQRTIQYVGFAVFIAFTMLAVALQQTIWIVLPFAALLVLLAFYYFRIGWWVLIASLPFAIECSVGHSLSTDMPSEPMMLLLAGLYIAKSITKDIALPKGYLQHPIFLLLVVSFLWYCLTAAFSTFPVLSAKYVLAKIWYIIAFVLLPLVLLQSSKQIQQVVWIYIAAVVLTVLYVLVQHYKRGFLFDEVNQSVQPLYRNHVNYAAVVVCTIPLAFASWRKAINATIKKIFFCSLLILLLGLVLSFSRGAWLALLVGVTAYALLRCNLLSKAYVVALIIVLAFASWLSSENRYIDYHPNYKKTIYHGVFNDHWQATFSGTDMSNAERINRWIAGLRMQVDKPWVGYGPNTFYNNYKPYMVNYFKTWVSSNPEQSTIHNYFLLTLVEQGWPGLLILMLLIFLVLRSYEKSYNSIDPFIKSTSATTAVIFTMVLVLNALSDLIETDKVGSIYYICIAVALILRLQKNKEAFSQ
jgi:O-antigen ligase